MKYKIMQYPFKSTNFTCFNQATIDSFFDNFLNYTETSSDSYMTVPCANIVKCAKGFSIELAAPGFTRDEFQLNISNGALTVMVNTEDTEEYEKSVTSREYKFQSFTRSWSLPEHTSVEEITARYDAGILYIDVPVHEDRIFNKKITVH
tara:strand:+ start:2369 stop:2815 length:447 start_codon:yes stop_codon:yes gene_type:complete